MSFFHFIISSSRRLPATLRLLSLILGRPGAALASCALRSSRMRSCFSFFFSSSSWARSPMLFCVPYWDAILRDLLLITGALSMLASFCSCSRRLSSSFLRCSSALFSIASTCFRARSSTFSFLNAFAAAAAAAASLSSTSLSSFFDCFPGCFLREPSMPRRDAGRCFFSLRGIVLGDEGDVGVDRAVPGRLRASAFLALARAPSLRILNVETEGADEGDAGSCPCPSALGKACRSSTGLSMSVFGVASVSTSSSSPKQTMSSSSPLSVLMAPLVGFTHVVSRVFRFA
mmetsp:Transcript_24634/g.77219  ORF Transcript_24634/g.77219 Transcript_24634/m.77219 type:complete len:288 (-) Transcript_24634:517-1380(-)